MNSALLVFVMVAPMVALVGAMAAGVWWMRRDQRRDPLTSDLRRLPGASLAAQVDAIGEKLFDNLFATLLGGVAMLLLVLLRRVPSDTAGFDWIDAVLCVCRQCSTASW